MSKQTVATFYTHFREGNLAKIKLVRHKELMKLSHSNPTQRFREDDFTFQTK